jgi:hypothetical protein
VTTTTRDRGWSHVLERLPDELGDVEHDFEAFAVLAWPHLARQRADDVVQPEIALVVGEVRDAADQLARATIDGSIRRRG